MDSGRYVTHAEGHVMKSSGIGLRVSQRAGFQPHLPQTYYYLWQQRTRRTRRRRKRSRSRRVANTLFFFLRMMYACGTTSVHIVSDGTRQRDLKPTILTRGTALSQDGISSVTISILTADLKASRSSPCKPTQLQELHFLIAR